MRNIKICVLLTILLLASFNVSYSEENLGESNSSSIETENIKANKATYEKAIEAINNKDFKTAITYLNAYISSKQKKYEAYKLRGDAYYALRQYDLAAKDYQTAIDLKSGDDKLITSTKYVSAVILGADKNEQLQNTELGNLYGRLMYAQKALNDIAYETSYAKAIEYNSHIYLPQPKKQEIAQINCPQKYGKIINPQGFDEIIYGAIDDIEKEDYTNAIFKSQKIISTYPKYYLGYYINGVALSELEKDDEAIIAFNKAIEYNPNDFESMASLGNIYFDKAQTTFLQEDARKSIEYFNKALKLNPNCYLYYFYIGMNELQLGNNDAAISSFNKAVKIKSNDYNSLYYKLIAQYLKGEYTQVIDGATKLLYKHVSNYNSVLYLRALAQYKAKDYAKSSADLDSILGNLGDIYNADIIEVTPKEQTLESYVYYLKALIAQSNGDGAKSDLEKAYKNPIIAMLSKAKKAIEPFEKTMNQEKITLDDYKKFAAFYETGLPKFLKSGVSITESDVDYQYDYIRTTFDDMGLSFVYKNPEYILATTKDYPYKKYSNKLTNENLAIISSENSEDLKQDILQKEKLTPPLKTSVEPEETLIQPKENSLAKILATSSYGLLGPSLPEDSKVNIVKAPENLKQTAEKEPIINKKPSVTEENSQNVKKLIEEEKNIEEIPTATKEAANEEKQEETTNTKVLPKSRNIKEKHANINPEEIRTSRPSEPKISETDEVIVLDKNAPSLYSEEDKKSTQALISKSLNPQNTDFESFSEETQKAITKKETSLQKALTEVSNEQTIEPTENIIEIKQMPQETVEVPVINVPQIDLPETKTAQQKEEIKNKTEENQIIPDLGLRPKAEIQEKEPVIEELSEKAKRKLEKAKAKQEAKIQKAKAKAEAKAEKERLKLEKAQQKELKRIKKAQEAAEKAVNDIKNIPEEEADENIKKTIIKQLEQ